MSTQDLNTRRSTLLQRYQPKTGSQDPLHTPMDTTPIAKSTSQRSLQNSTLLQKYYPKTNSQDLRNEPVPQADQNFPMAKKSTSQRSLDQSKLLQRYYKQNSQESQDVPKPEQQRYSSQKSLENSKLLQRYSQVNHSQEFTGLSAREGTPITRFTRSGSLDHDRIARPSLLSKYTPRFGKSLDRNKTYEVTGYSNYSSQQSLNQQETTPGLSPSQKLGDYGSDHFDQYSAQNIRSRSTSLAKGLARRSAQRELDPLSARLEMEKENMPLEAVTPETLPVVATSEPVTGMIATALPLPMLSAVTPAPILEVTQPPAEPVLEIQHPPPVQPSIIVPEPEKTKRKEPVKPPRKDLAPAPTVSIPIPTIKTTINVEPPKPIIPTKQEAPVVPKEPSPPLFSSRDHMEHYGSASVSVPSSSPPSTTQLPKPAAPTPQQKKNTLLIPISDFSSRRSMNDLRKSKEEEVHHHFEIDEGSERHELHRFSKKREPVKSTLASAFEQIAVLSVPQILSLENEEEKIEALPPDRKLKKRDHTYHPSFVPKQAKLEDEAKKKQEEKEKLERQKQEQERKKEDERIKKEEEKLRKESIRLKKEEEKRKKDEEKKIKVEEEKRRKEEEKLMKEEERRVKDEEKRKKDEEKKKLKQEKKKHALQKSLSAEQAAEIPLEDESLDLGSHLDQYTAAGPPPPRSISTGRPRSSGTPRGSQGALNRHTLPAMSSPMYSSQQSLDRSGGVQSKMLQRYAKRSGSQDFTHTSIVDEAQQLVKDIHRSQGSLDQQRISRSTLLQKYTPKPLSASTTVSVPPVAPKSTSQVSLDKGRVDKSALLQRYKPKDDPTDERPADKGLRLTDNEQRMSTVVFQQKKKAEKYSTFDYRDHEYEPIGVPPDQPPTKATPTAATLAPPKDDQKRKLSSASLRVPGDEADTISMEELQRNIEDRYFNREEEEEMVQATEGRETSPDKTSKMKAAMVRAQESGKKAMARAQESSRNAMVKAQQGGKSLQQKLRKQTDRFKNKMTTINIKKDRDVAPLASPEIVTTPELEKLDFTLAEPKTEQETGETEPIGATDTETAPERGEEAAIEGEGKKKFKTPEFAKLKNIHMPKIQKPEFKRPEFTKINKAKIPKLKAPDMSKFKRPEMPKFLTEKPDFSKIKIPEKLSAIKLQRSKSMKESAASGTTSAASPSEVESPTALASESSKGKIDYTNISTYPRILDKFKRQKSAPSNASVRAATPPPLEFTKAGKTSRPKGENIISRWAEKSSEDAGSTQFVSGSELGEREGSLERRMRQRFEQHEFERPELPVTAEQKQLEEYDKENREIHILSAARHDEFLKRKPPMERQESDLASEEEKQFWASSLGQKIKQNIDLNSNDFDFLDDEDRLRTVRENETMGLSERDRARFLEEPSEQSEKDYDMRSTTPYSNKECQSSGSSGVRRRKGVLEEIDDDEFFLRQKGISKDNIQMGEYISSAIKEGLGTPKNALAEMGRYDSYYDEDMDASERMSMEYRAEQSTGGLRYYQPSFESDDISNKQSFTDEFRKNVDFYKTFPPDRPMRKHKKVTDDEHLDDDQQKVPYDSFQQEEEDVEFYPHDRKYGTEQPAVNLEKDERYIDDVSVGNGFSATGTAVPPTPPRRRKKRFRDVTPSQLEPFGDGLTRKIIYNSFTIGPETHIFSEDVPLAQEESFTPLPTPRGLHSRSQILKAIEDDRISRGAESYTFGADDRMDRHIVDISESNGYAIVKKEPPPRPPAPVRRRKSTRSLGDQRQFSTLPNYHSVSPVRPSRNYSTISPSKPPRGRSSTSLNEDQRKPTRLTQDDTIKYESIDNVDTQLKLHEALQSGPVISKMKDRPLPPPPRPPRDTRKPRKPDFDDRFDFDGGAEKIVAHQFLEPRMVEEVEIAIQTDPVSEDYDLDIEVSETIAAGEISDSYSKTLQEILKEEQQAELDRARQLAEASNLMKDIQRFRDSTSSLSLHGSRPETPAAISVERRVSSPIISTLRQFSNENLTEQDLANAEDDKFIAELVKKYVSEEKVSDSTKKPQKTKPEPTTTADEIDLSKLAEIEASIIRDDIPKEETKAVRSEPAAPPRRRSLVASNTDIPRSIEIPPNIIEEIVERLKTNEQQHISELQQLHLQQLEDLRTRHEDQRQMQEQKLEEQQRQLLEQQNQQLHETQQLKEQILQQQDQQKALLQQQQQQQQQLLLAQQQQQLLLQQQEKERELQRERERELLREREIELEKARERERELHHARELELQRARELELQRAREIEQQRVRELELQRTMELEHQRLRELEIQRAQEVEAQRARETEFHRARELELQRITEIEIQKARETEIQRIREAELQRIREAELQASKAVELQASKEAVSSVKETEVKTPDEITEETSTVTEGVISEPVGATPGVTETVHGVPSTSSAAEIPKEATPVRPPPPRIPQIPLAAQFPYQEYLPYTLPPQSYYPVRNISDDEGALPHAPHRRRRHTRSRRESTSEEEYQREQRKQRHGTRSPEPSIPALSSQLVQACGASIRQTGEDFMELLRASSKEENKRDVHVAMVVLIIIIAALMALGMSGEKAVHHHHWDYFNPPGSSGND